MCKIGTAPHKSKAHRQRTDGKGLRIDKGTGLPVAQLCGCGRRRERKIVGGKPTKWNVWI